MSTQPLQMTPAQVTAAQTAQFKTLVQHALMDTRVAAPARVLVFTPGDPDNKIPASVTVEIVIREQIKTPTGPDWQVIKPIAAVPILLPRGGGYSVTLPLKADDEGLLVFCDSCIDAWLQSGGIQNQLQIRRHHVADCGFIPGLCSTPNTLANWSTNSMQIRRDDGGAIVDVSATTVSVKNYGGTPLPLLNDNFLQWFDTNILPFLTSKGYSGPAPPSNSETTILMGQ